MPNFHPQLVAAVAPLLEPGEEVWAVYPMRGQALVATARRLFVVGHGGTLAYPLSEFEQLRRPRPSLVLLQRRAGGALHVALDPTDEHGIQALTVIGLLVANSARPDVAVPDRVAPARSAPSPRRLLGTHQYALHTRPGEVDASTGRRRSSGWTGETGAGEHASGLARHGYRLGLTRFRTAAQRVE